MNSEAPVIEEVCHWLDLFQDRRQILPHRFMSMQWTFVHLTYCHLLTFSGWAAKHSFTHKNVPDSLPYGICLRNVSSFLNVALAAKYWGQGLCQPEAGFPQGCAKDEGSRCLALYCLSRLLYTFSRTFPKFGIWASTFIGLFLSTHLTCHLPRGKVKKAVHGSYQYKWDTRTAQGLNWA